MSSPEGLRPGLDALLVSRGALAWRDALRALLPVLDDVAALHRAGRADGDLRVGRVRVGDDGRGVLAAPPQERAGGAAAATVRLPEGRQRHLPPEGGAPSAAEDVHALGAVLRAALVGPAALALPPGVDPAGVAAGVGPELREAGVPNAVAGAVARALEPDPSRRWADAGELADALRAARRRRRRAVGGVLGGTGAAAGATAVGTSGSAASAAPGASAAAQASSVPVPGADVHASSYAGGETRTKAKDDTDGGYADVDPDGQARHQHASSGQAQHGPGTPGQAHHQRGSAGSLPGAGTGKGRSRSEGDDDAQVAGATGGPGARTRTALAVAVAGVVALVVAGVLLLGGDADEGDTAVADDVADVPAAPVAPPDPAPAASVLAVGKALPAPTPEPSRAAPTTSASASPDSTTTRRPTTSPATAAPRRTTPPPATTGPPARVDPVEVFCRRYAAADVPLGPAVPDWRQFGDPDDLEGSAAGVRGELAALSDAPPDGVAGPLARASGGLNRMLQVFRSSDGDPDDAEEAVLDDAFEQAAGGADEVDAFAASRCVR